MTDQALPHLVLEVFALVVGMVGAVSDVRRRIIPNWLTGPAMLVGLILHLVAGGWRECRCSLFALLLCGTVFLVFHLAGGMGAGDVKMIAAEGCLLGLSSAAPLLLYTALCGGAMALLLAMLRGKVRTTLCNVLELTAHHSKNGLQPHPELNLTNSSTLRLPYALAIAAGSVLTIVVTNPFGFHL